MKRLLIAVSAVLIVVFCLPGQTLAAPGNLTNPGFENGDLSGWNTGTVTDTDGVAVVTGDPSISSNGTTYSFTPYSGNYMVRLGTKSKHDQKIGDNLVYQDFIVAQDYPQLVFMYNLCTWDYPPYDYFHYEIIDLSEDPDYVIISYNQTAWGAKKDTSFKSTGWQKVTVDLTAYVGKNVRLQVGCGGKIDKRYCTYVYIDAQDDIPPETTATQTPGPDANGWNKTDVTIDLSAEDNTNGTGVKEIHYSISIDGSSTDTTIGGATTSFTLSEGIHTVTYYAVDNSGNQETTKSLEVKIDKTAPTITAPADVSVTTDSGKSYATIADLGTPITADNSGGTVTVSNDAPATFPLGTTTVTWTATDAAGNTATATQIVTVEDNEPPVFTSVPGAVTVNTDAGQAYATGVALGSATATDNSGNVFVTNNAPTQFPIGLTTITWTATDTSGNTATATQTVTVEDNESPTITAPADISTYPDAGMDYATIADLGTPATADNSGGTVTVSNDAPATFPLGTTTVTWTATDASGNTATATQMVTVIVNEPPVITITGPAAGYYNTDQTVSWTVTDVDLDTVTYSHPSPTTFSTDGIYQVTISATDLAGNIVSASSSQFTIDKTAPDIVISGVEDGVDYDTAVTPVITITEANLESSSITLNGEAFASGTIINSSGTYTLAVTAADLAGNSASQEVAFTVTIVLTDTTTSVTSSQNPSTYGQSVTFTVTVSAAPEEAETPTGTVQFKIDGADFGSPVTLSDGSATSQATSELAAGDHTVSAVYSGDDYFNGSTSADLTQTVTAEPQDDAQGLKRDTIGKLEGAMTGDKIINKVIDKIIYHINRSLAPGLWIDNTHLVFHPKNAWMNTQFDRFGKYGKTIDDDDIDDPDKLKVHCVSGQKHGITVFHQEKVAVVLLQTRVEQYEKEISQLEKLIKSKKFKKQSTHREQAELEAMKQVLPVFQEVIDDLVEADTILAEVSIADAKSTPVIDPKRSEIVAHLIRLAEKKFAQAVAAADDRPAMAVSKFGQAWMYSQLAMKFAAMEPKH